MSVFDHDMKGAHQLAVLGHWPDHIGDGVGERIDHHRPHRARILPNLHGQIKQRHDYSNRRHKLRERVDRFQSHDRCLTKKRENDDVDLAW